MQGENILNKEGNRQGRKKKDERKQDTMKETRNCRKKVPRLREVGHGKENLGRKNRRKKRKEGKVEEHKVGK